MLRKLLLASAAGLGLLAPLAAPPAADAHPYHHHRRHHDCYEVFYRPCPADPWRCYGTYHSFHKANHVAQRLAARGYEAFVR